MREILFRGKRKDYGKWVNGFLVMNKCSKAENGRLIYYTRPEIIPIGEIGEADYDGDGNYYEYVVMPETVGQYTGLTDKNGKKIFEGDIVKIESPLYGSPFWDGKIGKVVYEECSYFVEPENPIESEYLFADECAEFEVIGNIHDNPELLKGGEQ